MRSSLKIAALLALVLSTISAVPASAQGTTTGSIRGTVTDPQGEVMPGVTVRALSDALVAGQLSAITSEQGIYRFPSLPVGSYVLEANMPGFQSVRQEDVTVNLGQAQSIDLRLGDVTVSAEIIVTGRRGLSVWRLEARGRAAHSGLAFADGRSALAAAAGWAAGIQALSENHGGPIVNAGRIIGGDSEFVQDLGEEHRFVGTSQRLNVVADRCIVEGEARYLTLSDRDRVLDRMRSMAEASERSWDVAMHFEVVEEILPLPESATGADLAALLVETAAADGWTLELETDRGGVSFPNFLPDPAAVPVIDGLGPVGDGMHTRDEYVSLSSLGRRIRLIATLLEMLDSNYES